MTLLENLELVEVNYSDNKKKVSFVFLDEVNGEIREVTFNKQSYKDGAYVDDQEKEKQVNIWCDKYFSCSFDELKHCTGEKRNIYVYDNFSSLWEVEMTEKFTKDMEGQIYTATISQVSYDDIAVRIRYVIDGKTYETKHTHGKYMEGMQKWFKDPVKKNQVYKKFEDKYQCSVEDAPEKLVGKQIFVEVKCAFKKFYYGDIKAFPKEKK